MDLNVKRTRCLIDNKGVRSTPLSNTKQAAQSVNKVQLYTIVTNNMANRSFV